MNVFGRIFLNFIGGTGRWIFGTAWRTLSNKPRYKFREYLYGPEKNPDYYDLMGHQFNNRIIGALVLCFIIVPLVQLLFYMFE